MKVKTIEVVIEPDESADGNVDCTECHYNATTKRWTITGAIYPRHLKALAEISALLKANDKGDM